MSNSSTIKEDESPHDYRIKIEEQELGLINQLRIKRILEVFSGDGRNLAYFAKRGYTVFGMEINGCLIQNAAEILKKENFTAKIVKHPMFILSQGHQAPEEAPSGI